MNRANFSVLARAAAIALAVAWVYGPALRGDWLRDDRWEIARNAELRLPAGGLWRVWLQPAGANYLPLKTSVQWAERRLWGEERLGYHLVNVGLHIASALLFWRLLTRLLPGNPGAWLGGLLFAVHPLCVDSVAWMSELKSALSLPPLLLAACAYLDFDRGRRRGDLARAAAWFLASLLCDPLGAPLPACLLLHAWWRRGRVGAGDLRATGPLFALAAAAGAAAFWFQAHRALGGEPAAGGGPAARLAVAGLALAFYAWKCALPLGLSPVYPRWSVDPPSPLQFLPWLGLAAAVAAGGLARRGWGRPVLFALGCFFLALAPVLGLAPMAYFDTAWVANPLAYPALLAPLGLLAGALGAWQGRLRAPSARLVAAGAGVLAAALAFSARGYAAAFRDEEALWRHTLERYPDSWIAHNDLGLALDERGRTGEAVLQLEEALRLNPDSFKTRYDLGNLLAHSGRLDEAVGQFERALALVPDSEAARNELGVALARRGRLAEAEIQFEEALRLKPDDAEAARNLALARAALGRGGGFDPGP